MKTNTDEPWSQNNSSELTADGNPLIDATRPLVSIQFDERFKSLFVVARVSITIYV